MPVLLHYDVYGPKDGPILVLSGSVGSTVEMWDPNLDTLANDFRVVRLDHRGHGASPTLPGPYRIEDLADDCLRTLDTLGIERFSWCGLSMGAMIGMTIATSRPERLSRLVLCCTSAGLDDTSVWRDRAKRVTQSSTHCLASEIVERWFTKSWAYHHAAEVERAKHWISAVSDESYRHCCEAIAKWNHRKFLSAITVPTLVIAGKYDMATPVYPDSLILAERIPDANLEVLDAAHLATMEASEEANRAIIRHLKTAQESSIR